MRPQETFLLQRSSEQWLRDQAGPLPGTAPRGCVLIPLGVVVVGFVFLFVGRLQQNRFDSFKRNMAAAKGVVTNRRVSSSVAVIDVEYGLSDSEDTYHVAYRFEVPGPAGQRRMEAESSVSEKTYEGLKPGDEVTVQYDRTDPSFSRISGESELAPFVLVAFGVMQLGAGVIGVPLVLSVRNKKLALARQGERLVGHIVSCTSRKDDDGHLLVDVKYQFLSPSGQEMTASATAARPDLSEQSLPAAQTPVVVLYASDSNYQLM